MQVQIPYARVKLLVACIVQTGAGYLNHTDIYLTHLTYQMTDSQLYGFCVVHQIDYKYH